MESCNEQAKQEQTTSISIREVLLNTDAKDLLKEVAKVILITDSVYEILKITKEIVKLCIELKKA